MIRPTPWIERQFEFNFPVGLFPVIVERLKGTIPRLGSLLHNIPDDKLSLKKNGGWSIKEVTGHLFDLEELWLGRIEDFLAKKETLRAADMNNTKTATADHNSTSIEILLSGFTSARMNLVKIAENFDETTAALTALHPRLQKQLRLVDSLFFTAEHDDHELAKIRALLVD